ncbi:alkaline phosphatase D family protein [Streptomyces sp. NPDC047009]|uniref:DUF7800 domain-containing protein n=1 Tax=Streptomyces sp. NPDC047009 TaxID=3154496 RepID=UPI0033DBA773
MARLCLGPLLRYVDGSSATVWVEASRPCTAEVRCPSGAHGTARTFHIAGHHYAIVPVTGLVPGTTEPYEVLLDGTPVWPPPESPFPPSSIRTPDPEVLRVTFGSCRWAAPPVGRKDPVGPDALDTLAARLAAAPDAERPDVLLLLGDQVYADETSSAMRERITARRGFAGPSPRSRFRPDRADPIGSQVADYEEYSWLYHESWRDPEIRWLLSTVPSCMIFDDHDIIDDWNTSASWLAGVRATAWWRERLLSGLMSYWVHQHVGNLSPAELAADPLYAAVRETPDGTDVLRAYAAQADTHPGTVRWSYHRDFGRVRVVMVDTRAARVLDEDGRAMLAPAEAQWLREQALGARNGCDHLLIGSSLPWLLPHLVHDAEAWSAALCRGRRGARWARFGERLRQGADLEHWAAFPESFQALADLIAEAGAGPGAPASVSVLSGDVHHAYIAEPMWPDAGPDARVLQLTCSPVHNSVPWSIRLGFRFGWSGLGRFLGRRLARHGRGPRPRLDWRRRGGPWFGNHLMTLTLHGRSASLRVDRARPDGTGKARLTTVEESPLTTS